MYVHTHTRSGAIQIVAHMLRYVCRFIAHPIHSHTIVCSSELCMFVFHFCFHFVYFSFGALTQTHSQNVPFTIQLNFEWANTLMVGVYVSMRVSMYEFAYTIETANTSVDTFDLCECVCAERERLFSLVSYTV